MSSRGAPGPKFFNDYKGLEWDDFIVGLSKKYDVDKEEIFVGESSIPPNDTSCLVYVRITTTTMTEWFRKNRNPTERWVCWNFLEEVVGDPSKKGTYDVRKGIMYI